ncbi:stalk domain-containing protein [Anaerovorax odorimutans]|uniref:stalk domain-containing protein n=1 Tax=Anaerovorax odorimutans TaxID=109327 RepID=UPI000425AB43|nr:stalk domain-containing protein [Anaerovorax odorimutans]
MKQLKILLIITLFILVILSSFEDNNFAFAETVGVGVYINGNAVDFPDTKPYISNSRTLVPVRFVSEELGASVDWKSDTGMVVITKGSDNIKLVIGSTEVVKNEVTNSMDVAPLIVDGRTMVPLRFVSEQFGALVNWDSSQNSVLISTENNNTVYNVKAGDTLWDIALAYGVSIENILEVNPGLNPDKLTIDQQLNIPLSLVAKKDDLPASKVESESKTDPQTKIISRGGERTISLGCTAKEFVEYAKEYIGVPYAYGGTTPEGFDCSGFTQYVAAHFDGYLPHSSSEQYYCGIRIEKTDLQLGDLVFFESSVSSNKIGHVGIYIGDGKFIHSPQSGGSVEISNMSNVYFDKCYYGAIRLDTKNEN